MPLTPLTTSLGLKNAKHLLRRATFGATKAQIDSFASLTPNAALNQLFQATPDPLPPVDPANGQTWVGPDAVEPTSEEDGILQETFKRWWLGLMLSGGASIKERIVWFMHVYFTTIQSFVENSRSFYYQNALFRQYALDGSGTINFKELTKKICLDNAMLKFLDGRLNTKGKPQENFARELFELYTVGRGRNVVQTAPDDYVVFTQSDIEQATLVLTGYNTDNTFENLDPDTNLPRGIVKSGGIQHDNNSKTFSQYFANTTISPDPTLLDNNGNPTEESMLKELDDLIEMIYASEETAMNICRRIYRFFCHYNITDDIDTNIISNLAATFRNNGFRIQPVIVDLLRSQHFYDSVNGDVNDDNYGALIKSPLELTLGTFRVFGINQESQFSDFQANMAATINSMDLQGINFFEPFEVAGYAPYHQEPVYNRNWISTNRLANRYDFINSFLDFEMGENQFGVSVDIISFVESNVSNPGDINTLLDELVLYLLPEEITTERKNYFKFILNEGLPDANWTVEWNNRASGGSEVSTQLIKLFNAMMQSPEYQLF